MSKEVLVLCLYLNANIHFFHYVRFFIFILVSFLFPEGTRGLEVHGPLCSRAILLITILEFYETLHGRQIVA